MTVDTYYGDTADEDVWSNNGTYATALSTPAGTHNNGTGEIDVGQEHPNNYFCDEGFIGFDTSAIDDADVVSAAVLSLYCVGASNVATAFTCNARLTTWGAAVTTADWIAGASLSALTLVAHKAVTSSTSTVAYTAFVDDALAANINKTGATQLVLSSNRMEAGTAPTGGEYIRWYSADAAGTTNDPKLVVTHAAAASTKHDPMGMSGFFGA